MRWINYKLPPFWSKIKYWLGYSLFVLAITYGLSHTPSELWQIRSIWLLLAALVVLTMFILQGWQVMIFLKYHHVQSHWLYPALFTARKGVLNTVLPAKSGTLVLITMLTKKYQLKWYDFIIFMLVGSIASLLVSLLGIVWLLFPLVYTLLLLLLILVMTYFSIRYRLFVYASCFPLLLIIAFGLYLSTIMAFFCLLRGLGFQLSFIDISYFAVVLNVLAQFSFTPGNVGVREIVVGIMAPYVSLPISVGIIASAILYIVRLLVYSVILFWLEWLFKKSIVVK
ncbi:lysylphosphatidylglycerol synthase domain-containing protein [Candidatus Parabeggiatoa sp. HSG14]|uniref:lysylphosphatidylglycerol synthase domain-containing protein n=1 Tax=Candidatus Parabeggiatoa sp. HSG14 TaxID=3055593 RepID=UPI0025A85F12|nr:hypothetical protein [Thiotrichales bacterium HSG14]